MPSEELRRMIEADIASLDWSNIKLVAYLGQHPAYRPKEKLSILIFAYSTGLFETDVISSLCSTDPVYRLLCHNDPPGKRDLVRFRRENRGLVKQCLIQVMKHLIRHRFEMDEKFFPIGLKRLVEDLAQTRLDLASHVDRGAGGLE
jgi:hypothetical protein